MEVSGYIYSTADLPAGNKPQLPRAGLDGLENRKISFRWPQSNHSVSDLPQRSLVTKSTGDVLLVFPCLFADNFAPLY